MPGFAETDGRRRRARHTHRAHHARRARHGQGEGLRQEESRREEPRQEESRQGGFREEGFREEGFLLLEALIGLALIGVVAIALLSATAQQVRSADKASVLLVASALAQDRAAAIQFLDAESLANPPDSLLQGTFPHPFDDFTWRAQVTAADPDLFLFLLQVEVEGRGEGYPLETLVHRPGANFAATEAGGAAAAGPNPPTGDGNLPPAPRPGGGPGDGS